MNHPYKKYEQTSIWCSVWTAIEELAENNDLEEMTAREYVVGYICEKIKGSEKSNNKLDFTSRNL
ncbi:hypothetical protein [uncultured Rummeliibacillus sp.]|uniref:hypothetical protein n=1 Tax=uncultured Rummeliibacillus sp. TaxID=762292 RepID=UPI002639A43A|nr:hypothetical protein [uncultured Rummeliibacillus sp.]